MANRCILHRNHLDTFKEWLKNDGWEIEDTKGLYEVLRARKEGRREPLIVFEKAGAKEHLSVMDRDLGVVKAFLSAKQIKSDNSVLEDIKTELSELQTYKLYAGDTKKIDLQETFKILDKYLSGKEIYDT